MFFGIIVAVVVALVGVEMLGLKLEDIGFAWTF